jgi:hypothetical protein
MISRHHLGLVWAALCCGGVLHIITIIYIHLKRGLSMWMDCWLQLISCLFKKL